LKNIGVVGAGQMGCGIAHVAATSGYSVTLFDISPDQLKKANDVILKNIARQVEKGLYENDAVDKSLKRIVFTNDLQLFCDSGFIIEAVPEIESLKMDVLKRLDQIAPAETILASNTSSFPITKLASATKRADRVIGMHFMNPVPMMKLVEVIRGFSTSEATFTKTIALAQHLGKETAVAQDYPGFIVNRVLIPMINEAIFALFEGVGSAEDIDRAMYLGTNQPMGPLTLADFIGLDTVLAIMEVLYRGFNDPKYRPCPLLIKMVEAGFLGRKVGRGFYEYPRREA
jgi:3-hydroxybutyryl-CoA dehydrogenase